MAVIHVTKDTFEAQVLNNPGKVLLDFWAPWCGPCRMVAPVLDEITEEDASITIAKVNVDEEVALANRFGIMSIPTLIAFDGGKETGKLIGYRPKADILALLK